MEFLEKVKAILTPNEKGFTAILVGSIMAIDTSGYRSVDNVVGKSDRVRNVSDHLCRS